MTGRIPTRATWVRTGKLWRSLKQYSLLGGLPGSTVWGKGSPWSCDLIYLLWRASSMGFSLCGLVGGRGGAWRGVGLELAGPCVSPAGPRPPPHPSCRGLRWVSAGADEGGDLHGASLAGSHGQPFSILFLQQPPCLTRGPSCPKRCPGNALALISVYPSPPGQLTSQHPVSHSGWG